MACRESCALVHYAQRCSVSDVMPLVRGGMGHRLSIIYWFTAEQSQRGLDINIISTCTVDRGGDGYGHRFGEGKILWFQREHRTHSHPVFEVVEWFISSFNLKPDKSKHCYLSSWEILGLEIAGVTSFSKIKKLPILLRFKFHRFPISSVDCRVAQKRSYRSRFCWPNNSCTRGSIHSNAWVL